MEKPEYLSNTYYNVVIGDGKYLGWYTVFVGDGSMTFRHDKYGDKKFKETGESISWMQDCWEQFIEFTKNQNEG